MEQGWIMEQWQDHRAKEHTIEDQVVMVGPVGMETTKAALYIRPTHKRWRWPLLEALRIMA